MELYCWDNHHSALDLFKFQKKTARIPSKAIPKHHYIIVISITTDTYNPLSSL